MLELVDRNKTNEPDKMMIGSITMNYVLATGMSCVQTSINAIAIEHDMLQCLLKIIVACNNKYL